MYRMAMMGFALGKADGVDSAKCVKMALAPPPIRPAHLRVGFACVAAAAVVDKGACSDRWIERVAQIRMCRWGALGGRRGKSALPWSALVSYRGFSVGTCSPHGVWTPRSAPQVTPLSEKRPLEFQSSFDSVRIALPLTPCFCISAPPRPLLPARCPTPTLGRLEESMLVSCMEYHGASITSFGAQSPRFGASRARARQVHDLAESLIGDLVTEGESHRQDKITREERGPQPAVRSDRRHSLPARSSPPRPRAWEALGSLAVCLYKHTEGRHLGWGAAVNMRDPGKHVEAMATAMLRLC